jgi:hypothetical protein
MTLKIYIYILFIISFITKCNAYCNMNECNQYCYLTKQIPNDNKYRWYGVCEPINSPPEERECNCCYHNLDKR